MPEFYTGEEKVALVPVTNPTAKAFDYEAVLYMGLDLDIMSQVSFHLEAGESKTLSMSVTMPSVAGVYPVHLGAFSSGVLIKMYQADDVVLTAPVSIIDITGFYYLIMHSGYPMGPFWLTGPMPGPHEVRWIGFRVNNPGAVAVSGVTVAFWVDSANISSPVYQFPPPGDAKVVFPPFTIEPGYPTNEHNFFFSFVPAYRVPSYIAVAEVRVDGVLVDTRSLTFYPEWPEVPTKSLGLTVSGLSYRSVLSAPLKAQTAVITTDLGIDEIARQVASAGASISYNLKTYDRAILAVNSLAAEEVDVAVCRANSVEIVQGPGPSTVFMDKGSVAFSLVEEQWRVGNAGIMTSLLQLSIIDACLGLGIPVASISYSSNDVYINGRKVAGLAVRSSALLCTGMFFCNLSLDTALAEAVLKGRVRAYEITSISAELGSTVPETSFRSLLMQSIARRFNLAIYW